MSKCKLHHSVARFVAAWTLGMAVIASAHSELEHSQPGPGSTLTVPPLEIHLHFTSPVERGLSAFELVRDSKITTLKPLPSSDDLHIVLSHPNLGSGRYVLRWSVFARDGHRTRGEFTFSVVSRE